MHWEIVATQAVDWVLSQFVTKSHSGRVSASQPHEELRWHVRDSVLTCSRETHFHLCLKCVLGPVSCQVANMPETHSASPGVSRAWIKCP